MEQGEDLAGEAYQRRKDPREGENDAGKDSESAAKRQNDNQEEKTKPSKDDKHTHFHSH